MSGIVGLFQFENKDIDQTVLAAMMSTLRRQGPDAQAYWMQGNVALGHTLLGSTRCSFREQQPATRDQQVWISADARIDDQATLRTKLAQEGIQIESDATDDHLILMAYGCWGTDCLNHLIGDFAFVLWDQRRKIMLAATDHFGVSPLYYTERQGGFGISNNLACLRLHPEVSDRLDEHTIGDYLLYRMNHNPCSTTLADIKKLPAGHRIIVTDNSVKVDRYWSAPTPNYIRRSEAEQAEMFNHLFTAAVSDRLRADSAGTHMSGGMDSTSISAVLSELKAQGKTKDIQAYNHASHLDDHNLEQGFAEETAQKLGLPLQVHRGDREIGLNQLFNPADFTPEPSVMQVNSARYHIFTDCSARGRTLFAGFGGDPLLAADASYWAALRTSGQIRHYIADIGLQLRIQGRLPRALLPDRLNKYSKSIKGYRQQPIPSWIGASFVSRTGLNNRHRELFQEAEIYPDQRIGMTKHALWRRIFEWHSPAVSLHPLKVRFPFFDVRLLEWAQSVPQYPWFEKKYLLRKIMQGRLPQSVLNRAKTPMPGSVMVANAKREGLPKMYAELAVDPILSDYVDIGKISAMVSEPEHLTAVHAKSIVRLSSLAYWLRLNLSNRNVTNAKLSEFQRRQ
ncbi:asparagine synthetase B [Amylibacter marinus]|uniref:asparagine synthase (glutamine-hydrolyzing) n=1 Tax=Amylibacter marinus TaxID=1475483 RepID=A0ABQ5VRU7_9RHOB|nr:asparagine synthase-related protein [Amylibacter marinus]GLQ34145.1 asparagine synthetase B [Amylibacter marinus]